jgi:hypothetical protein
VKQICLTCIMFGPDNIARYGLHDTETCVVTTRSHRQTSPACELWRDKADGWAAAVFAYGYALYEVVGSFIYNPVEWKGDHLALRILQARAMARKHTDRGETTI